jgi:hypothetical protein
MLGHAGAQPSCMKDEVDGTTRGDGQQGADQQGQHESLTQHGNIDCTG